MIDYDIRYTACSSSKTHAYYYYDDDISKPEAFHRFSYTTVIITLITYERYSQRSSRTSILTVISPSIRNRLYRV